MRIPGWILLPSQAEAQIRPYNIHGLTRFKFKVSHSKNTVSTTISNFASLPPAFKDLAEASRKAEGHIMGDPRAACFALEAAVKHRAFHG